MIISFKYDPAAVIAMGLNVDRLRPAYFSTTTNSWTLPDSYVVDENRHIITMQIDHFTRFGILSLEGSNQIFLPIVLK